LSTELVIPPTVGNRESASRILERSQKVRSFVQSIRPYSRCWPLCTQTMKVRLHYVSLLISCKSCLMKRIVI